MSNFAIPASVVESVSTLVLVFIAVLISYIFNTIVKYVKRKTEDSKNAAFFKEIEFYLVRLEDIVKDVCTSTYELYTKEMKKASEDGKLTKDEVIYIKDIIVNEVKKQINELTMGNESALTILEKVLPNIDAWILNKAEGYLPGVKAIYKQLEMMDKK